MSERTGPSPAPDRPSQAADESSRTAGGRSRGADEPSRAADEGSEAAGGPKPTEPAPESDVREEHEGDRRLLVIIPTFNERENLPRVVPMVLAQDSGIEVLVVDDDSPDGTGEVADALARAEPRVHVLHRDAKDGLGPAYRAGFRWALTRGYDLICEMDADLSHPPEQLRTFLDKMEEADVVVGSRYVDGRVTVVNWPVTRLLLSYFGCFYARTITRLPVQDATGGFNCFRRKVLETVDLDAIESNGYAFQIELKLRAWRRGFRLIEVPIVFTERDTGESKMSKRIVAEAVWKVWKFRLMDLAGRL